MNQIMILAGVMLFFLFVGGLTVVIAKFYRKVEQGRALIINKLKANPEVTFTGGTVWPIFHKAEVMDISVKTIEIDRRGKDGLICQDNIRGDIKVTFFVRVNKTSEDVIKVAQAIGCARASDQKTLEDLFIAKFSEALKTVGKQLDFCRPLHQARRVPRSDHRDYWPRPERLCARGCRNRLPGTDGSLIPRSAQHPRRSGHT